MYFHFLYIYICVVKLLSERKILTNYQCDERRDLKKKRYETEGAKEYREANRRIQMAVKKAKEDWIGAQCEEIETCLNKNNSKRAYQLVKDLTSEKQGRSSTIQDKSGKCLTEEKEILSRWTEY